MDHDHTVDGVPNDPGNPGEAITVMDILASYAAAGYDTEMRVTADASVHCHACGVDHPPRELLLGSVRRIEGASDPDGGGDHAHRGRCTGRGPMTLPPTALLRYPAGYRA